MRDQLLTPHQLAQQIQKPVRTLEQWRYRRTGPRFVKVGRDVRYRQVDIDAWLAGKTHGQAA